MFKIEKNVQVPAARYQWGRVLREMEPGDSFFVSAEEFPISGKQSVCAGAHTAGKVYNFKMATRTVEGGMRIWRVS